MVFDPGVARRRLGAELRQARENSRMTLEDVSSETLISTSKLSRIETGLGPPLARDVRDLVKLYELAEDYSNHLSKLGEQGRERAWWRDYLDKFTSSTEAFLSFESTATWMQIYSPLSVPDLLQTPQFARETIRLTRTPSRPEREIQDLVEFQMERISRSIDSVAPPALDVILDEGLLLRVVGQSPLLADEQLSHLTGLASVDHISLRVIPFAAGLHPGYLGGFTVFGFGDGQDQDVAYQESPIGDRHTKDPSKVQECMLLFRSLADQALAPETSKKLLHSLLHRSFE